MLKIITGNIFQSKCDVIVNPVNCVGVMGAGLALEFRLRFPDMIIKYEELCEKKLLDVGLLWIYKDPSKTILNFPTKKHWKGDSKIEYISLGLEKFVQTYKDKNVKSIAFPVLGSGRGGIDENASINLMKKHLSNLDIEIEIYKYDPKAHDDLFLEFKEKILQKTVSVISDNSKIKEHYIRSIIEGVNNNNTYQINQLLNIKGVGIKTVEKVFRYCQNHEENNQKTLF